MNAPFDRLAASIGATIRRARLGAGVSVIELARRAEVSKATLTNLESGNANPTLETLTAIAGVLDLSLSEFLGPQAGAPAVHLTPTSEAVAIEGEAVTVHFLRRFFSGATLVELYLMRMRPNATQRSAAHAHGLREHIVLFRGELTAGPVGEEVAAAPGDMLSFDADRPHAYASGAEPVEATLLMECPADQAHVALAASPEGAD